MLPSSTSSQPFRAGRRSDEFVYVSELIDYVSANRPDWSAVVADKFGVKDIRNINGVPHVVVKKAVPISVLPAGQAYALILSLALGAGRHVFIDGIEHNMHPALLDAVVDMVAYAVDMGAKVAVVTNSIEALDKLSAIAGRGHVVRMKDCKIHDVIPMEDVRHRIDELYEDLRLY